MIFLFLFLFTIRQIRMATTSDYYMKEIIQRIEYLYNDCPSKEKIEFICTDNDLTKYVYNEIKCNLVSKLNKHDKNNATIYKIGIEYLSIIYKNSYVHIQHMKFEENDEVLKITMANSLQELLELQ